MSVDMIKAKVKPLFRVQQNQYKETLARFRKKDIIHDIHEIFGSIKKQPDTDLEAFIYTSKENCICCHTGIPFSKDDIKRLDYVGHQKDEENMKGSSAQGQGLKMTLAARGERDGRSNAIQSTKDDIKNFEINNENSNKFSYLIAEDSNNKLFAFTCIAYDTEDGEDFIITVSMSEEDNNIPKNVIDNFRKYKTKHDDITTMFIIKNNQQHREVINENSLKSMCRIYFNGSCKVYLNDGLFSPMYKEYPFIDKMWGDPFMELAGTVYENDSIWILGLKKIDHVNYPEKNEELPDNIYLYLNKKDKNIDLIGHNLSDMICKNDMSHIETDPQWEKIWEGNIKGQNSSTRKGQDNRCNFYDEQLCRAPIFLQRIDNLVTGLTPKSDAQYFKTKSAKGKKKLCSLFRTDGNGSRKYEDVKYHYDDNQNIQYQINEYPRKYKNTLFDMPPNKIETNVKSCGYIRQVAFALVKVAVKYLWKTTMTKEEEIAGKKIWKWLVKVNFNRKIFKFKKSWLKFLKLFKDMQERKRIEEEKQRLEEENKRLKIEKENERIEKENERIKRKEAEKAKEEKVRENAKLQNKVVFLVEENENKNEENEKLKAENEFLQDDNEEKDEKINKINQEKDDLENEVEKITAENAENTKIFTSKEKKIHKSYVYILTDKGNPTDWKIGFTDEPDMEKFLKKQYGPRHHPRGVDCWCFEEIITCYKYRMLGEKMLLNRYSQLAIPGTEWFVVPSGKTREQITLEAKTWIINTKKVLEPIFQ